MRAALIALAMLTMAGPAVADTIKLFAAGSLRGA